MNRYLLIFLVLTSTNACAALNKWVDADGKVHYTDSPPPPDAKVLRTVPGAATSKVSSDSSTPGEPAPAKTIVEREAEWKKAQQAKKEAADKATKEQADAEAKNTYCDGLRQNLRGLQEGLRVVEFDAAGKRTFIDDRQRQERIAKTQQDISTRCK